MTMEAGCRGHVPTLPPVSRGGQGRGSRHCEPTAVDGTDPETFAPGAQLGGVAEVRYAIDL